MIKDESQPSTSTHASVPSETGTQVSRKRKRNPETWKKNKIKALTAQGISHTKSGKNSYSTKTN